MFNIVHRVGIKAPASQAYQALTTLDGLAGWWTRETTGTPAVGQALAFNFRTPEGVEIGGFTMEVLQHSPADKVRWRVVNGPADWIGTHIHFSLAEQDGMTIVLFEHRDWREQTESMAHCSTKWATFLLSLRDYVERGTGQPAPGDVKIDNWN